MKRMAAVMLAGALALGSAACGRNGDSGTDTPPETYVALMTGFNETPVPINTPATGEAEIVFTGGGFTFEVSVKDIQGVTGAHIHTAQTGGIVFNLRPNTTVTSGILVAGVATAGSADFSPGFSMDSVKSLMRRGNAYVNVHTTADPGGHIRGQLVRDQ